MGKRKMNQSGDTYYQCDYTMVPMPKTFCYRPEWKDGKLVKNGSYCCWEAVLAHVYETRLDDVDYIEQVERHIKQSVGARVTKGPHRSRMSWLSSEGDISSVQDYINVECAQSGSVTVIELTPDGKQEAVEMDRGFLASLPKFTTSRKRSGWSGTLVVHHMQATQFNTQATQMFKQNLHGSVYVAACSTEPCLVERTRYLDFTPENFALAFKSKRKERVPAASGMDNDEYEMLKQAMQQELSHVESSAAALAEQPGTLAKAATMPPAMGAEMARLYPPSPLRQMAVEVH